jgi:hypothetical protein
VGSSSYHQRKMWALWDEGGFMRMSVAHPPTRKGKFGRCGFINVGAGLSTLHRPIAGYDPDRQDFIANHGDPASPPNQPGP